MLQVRLRQPWLLGFLRNMRLELESLHGCSVRFDRASNLFLERGLHIWRRDGIGADPSKSGLDTIKCAMERCLLSGSRSLPLASRGSNPSTTGRSTQVRAGRGISKTDRWVAGCPTLLF